MTGSASPLKLIGMKFRLVDSSSGSAVKNINNGKKRSRVSIIGVLQSEWEQTPTTEQNGKISTVSLQSSRLLISRSLIKLT
jgi:hypothetical protein